MSRIVLALLFSVAWIDAWAQRYLEDLPEDGGASGLGGAMVVALVLAIVFWEKLKELLGLGAILLISTAISAVGLFIFRDELTSAVDWGVKNPIVSVVVLGAMFFWAINKKD